MRSADAIRSASRASARLRGEAERVAGALPPLLVAAERLASTILLGAHGRRRAGPGETFWQYRRAAPGDAAGAIDWRRSARGDALFVRETEWEQPQTVWLWCDKSRAMSYRSAKNLPRKSERAALLCAALAVLLMRGGERLAAPRLGAAIGAERPQPGEAQLRRIVTALSLDEAEDFGAPPQIGAARGGRAVFCSDFFGEEATLTEAVRGLSAAGVSGVLLQVVDPAEESFPFDGRVLFESMTGALSYDAEKAQSLREAYVRELAARRDRLDALARSVGWRFHAHRTDEPAAPALLWAARSLGAGAGRDYG